ncbi:hypothetical protein PGRAT_21410 [Paenibacillus graminis]|uniref:Uncharacterized protein n=1 Tax=Paenibacillus graminis TaxID=189425 RepID=A0A089NLK9_9BACL|nr:hypothetical protein PGRAT_21410 [Paenibacillus graminis]
MGHAVPSRVKKQGDDFPWITLHHMVVYNPVLVLCAVNKVMGTEIAYTPALREHIIICLMVTVL